MAAPTLLKQRSTFTGIAAACFAAGVLLTFIGLYRTGSSLLVAAGLVLLAATVASWSYAAYCER